jgi:hypothetical protein
MKIYGGEAGRFNEFYATALDGVQESVTLSSCFARGTNWMGD